MKVAKSNNRTHEPGRKKKQSHSHTQQQQQQPLITQFDREIRECLDHISTLAAAVEVSNNQNNQNNTKWCNQQQQQNQLTSCNICEEPLNA